jgi:iron complex outermembrane recepter protein
MKFVRRITFLLALPGLLPAAGAAAETGDVAGRTLLHDGSGVAAQVRVLGTTRQVVSAPEGGFRFVGLPAGRWVLEAQSARHGRGVVTVDVTPGVELEVEIRLSREIHGGELTVTAAPDARREEELARPVSVLAGADLLAAIEPSLGETLARQPGVSTTYFGPGASRPIIRGLGGDRIRVLDNGLGAGDVSATSPDHAVAVDPLLAQRIEIVRGPATLLYGSSAVGGVVNVLDASIPDYLPEAPVTGSVTLVGATAADERAGALELGGRLGRWAWHVDASKRNNKDVDIPGFAESRALREEEHDEDEGEEDAFGTLPNSSVESSGARLGLSWIGRSGFVGVAVSGFDTLYGVPGHAHGRHDDHDGDDEHGDEDEEEVRIDLEQRRIDLRGEWNLARGLVRGIKVRAGRVDYEHRELEGDEVGTLFLSDSWEARVEARHRPFGALTGAWGVQVGRRDFEAIGEEAFVPPNESKSRALFAFEELAAGAFTWQLGARYERAEVTVSEPGLPDRSFSGISGSAGVVWKASDALSASLALSRSVTLPNAEALYSDGPHVATRVFEVGDPTLEEEVSLGVELGLRYTAGRFRGELDLFRNRVDDFIYEAFTGEEEDGLPVVEFRQADARLAGFEAAAHVELYHAGERHLELDLTVDAVRARLADASERLPRIPPLRAGGALRWRSDRWSASADVLRVARQDRVAPFESATDGYTLVGASVGVRFFRGDMVHDLLLAGRNLTDEEARVHASYLKDLAPLPGRDVRLTYRVSF